MSSLIEIRNACVTRDGVAVFDRLSLMFRRGEHAVVLGPNGAGKSTLLKLITRELYPLARDETSVRVFGREQWDVWELRSHLGVISHDLQRHCLERASGRGIVLSGFYSSLGTWEHQRYSPEQLERADELLHWLGAKHLRDRMWAHLSTGEQRRLLLGRALVHRPELLILDEPTSGLDLKACFQYLDTLRALMRSGVTVIIVTHHIHEIPPEVERVVLLKNGTVAGDGVKAELLTDQQLGVLFDTPVRIVHADGWYQVVPGAR